MDKLMHILNTHNQIQLRTLCGLRGRSSYDPTKANCKDCLERFKSPLPRKVMDKKLRQMLKAAITFRDWGEPSQEELFIDGTIESIKELIEEKP